MAIDNNKRQRAMDADQGRRNRMRISVVTATWNSAATVEDTLRSVAAQTYGEVEHIVVDGGSTDGTMEIVRRYAEIYRSRGMTLKWISEKDNGIYDAMNKGIAMASGEVVGLLNSDDFFTSPTVLEQVARGFRHYGAEPQGHNNDDGDNRGLDVPRVDAVYGDIHYVKPGRLGKCVRYYSSKGFRRWKMRMGFMPAHPSFYCRTEIYRRHGLFDTSFRIAADFEQLLRLIFIQRISIRYIPVDFVTMRTGGASSSGFRSHRQIYAEHRRAYRKNNVYSNFILESLRYIAKIIEVCRANLN